MVGRWKFLFWKGPFAWDIRSFLGGRYTHKLIWNIYFGKSTKIKACKRWLLPFPQKDSKSKVERQRFEQKQAWHYGLQFTPDTSSHICSPATQFWTPHRATSTKLCKFMFLSWRLVDLFASFRTFFLNPRSCFAVEPNMQMVFSPTKHSLEESSCSHLPETESALQAQSNNKWHVVNLGYIFRLVGGFFPTH